MKAIDRSDSKRAGARQGGRGAVASAVLGWREWLGLPQLGIAAIRAKVDTGARSSSLHVEFSESFQHGGAEWVRFGLLPERSASPATCEAPVLDRREVTDSSGHRSLRVFICTELDLGGVRYPIELNLTDRRQMLFPMLLGRTAIAGRWVVDPGRSFVLGERVDD